MTLTITSTEEIVVIDGVPCRLWTSQTPNGVDCEVFVHRLAVPAEQDQSELLAEFLPQVAPASLSVDPAPEAQL